MDSGDIASNALKYPLTNFKKVLIVGILTILSSLIIPGFLVLGYLFKIIKESLEGSSELPDFNDWTSIFTDGLKVFVVLFIYTFIPFILILLGIWKAILPMLTIPGAGSILYTSFSPELFGGVVSVGLGLLVVVSFFIPVALARMVQENRLSSAFKFKEITRKIREIGWVDYLIWYVVMLIVLGVVYFISSFLVFPLLVGIIIVPLIILPYLGIFSARSVALMYGYEDEGKKYYRKR